MGALVQGTAAALPDTSREFFERMYRAEDDPWGFASSEYELGRYAAILKAIGDRRFWMALEPGCSVGVLTERLARVADEVVAMDLSQAAVDRARERCAGLKHVDVRQGSVEQASAVGCDLLVLSEIGYYFTAAELARWSGRLMREMDRRGVVIAAHWLGHSPDHVLHGDEVGEVLREVAVRNGLRLEQEERFEEAGDGFRLDVWVKYG